MSLCASHNRGCWVITVVEFTILITPYKVLLCDIKTCKKKNSVVIIELSQIGYYFLLIFKVIILMSLLSYFLGKTFLMSIKCCIHWVEFQICCSFLPCEKSIFVRRKTQLCKFQQLLGIFTIGNPWKKTRMSRKTKMNFTTWLTLSTSTRTQFGQQQGGGE